MNRLIFVSGEWWDEATTAHAFQLVHMRATSTICYLWTRNELYCHSRRVGGIVGAVHVSRRPYWIHAKHNIKAMWCIIVLTCRTRASNAMRCEAVLWQAGAVRPIPCNPRTVTINESMIFKLKEHTMVDWHCQTDSRLRRATPPSAANVFPCSTCRMEFLPFLLLCNAIPI